MSFRAFVLNAKTQSRQDAKKGKQSMYDLILQGSILVVGIGYLAGLMMIADMRNKTLSEKISFAGLLTLTCVLIEFTLIAALFNQGGFG